jgi:hypothetical protein
MNTETCPQGLLGRDVGRHTPGPWEWKDGWLLQPTAPYLNGSCYRVIINIEGGYVRRDCEIAAMRAEQEANMRVIAAAPDMLADLRRFLAPVPEGWDALEWHEQCCKYARETVEKALGVTPNAALTGRANEGA